MLRGALIGLGNVAVQAHVPAWIRRPDAAIVAVADARPARRATARTSLPGARWTEPVEAVFGLPDLDFVDICTPPASHAPLIRAALQRGLHVLCEKPLVGSLDELNELVPLAAAAKRVLHTVHNWHHAPIVRRATELVRGGAIGRVVGVTWHTLRTQPAATGDESGHNWRLDPAVAGGGVLTDHGWHVAYLLRAWLGESPIAVSARLETRRHTAYPIEDTATLRLTFPRATSDVLLTWAAETRCNWAELTGTGGVLELADDVLVWRGNGHERRWACPPPLSQGSVHPEWFEAVVDEFLVDARRAAPDGSNLAEACACVALETAARESDRDGGVAVSLAVPGRPAAEASS
jgi:predicted dehydrogenase